MVDALTLILLFTIGYAALRTSVCMVMAAREIVADHSANRLTGFLLAAACAALAMAASRIFGRDPFSMIPGYPASLSAIFGGALFAAGASVNRRCAMGTLAALAAGDICHLATLVGMVVAAAVATPFVHNLFATMSAPPITPSLLADQPVLVIAAGAAIIVILLVALLSRNLRRARAPRLWSPLFAMSLIGGASGLLFALDSRWPYTSLITQLAAGEAARATWQIGQVLMLMAGMVIAAWIAGIARINPGTARKWINAGLGGLLMGIGASFVPGGNDAMLMTGMPLLLPNLVVAYASMIVVLLMLEWLRYRAQPAAANDRWHKSALYRRRVVLAAARLQPEFTPMLIRSPLAPAAFPSLPEVGGVARRVARAQYKQWDRCDLTYVELAPGTTVAGVFTRNVCCSSEVELGREQVKIGTARALIVNAGNSNAFTGYRGREAVDAIMAQVAAHLDCTTSEVFVSSTGVIGVPLPKDKARDGVAAALRSEPCSWEAAAETICTTDTFAKGSAASAVVGNTTVQVAGIVKGSGMIAPDMATMLGYIFTDAAIAPALLQEMLSEATDRTFNSITVDSDTSTSDTVLLFATGQAGNMPLASRDDPGADALYAAINAVALDLAHQVVRDGEGASKFIEVQVTGAVSDDSAKRVALSIANSPLVKTAIAGEDANWGRVVMAVGKAGEPADRDRLAIRFGDHWVAKDGLPIDGYDETPVAAHLKGQDIRIGADLGLGEGRATVWTCDLTHGYISINADYRS